MPSDLGTLKGLEIEFFIVVYKLVKLLNLQQFLTASRKKFKKKTLVDLSQSLKVFFLNLYQTTCKNKQYAELL
ncbi:hypothetical protein TCEA9_24190 [Thermobrachium celere]|nr:hypothetical protein TCEA9_24190 [Thermobrachium celere]